MATVSVPAALPLQEPDVGSTATPGTTDIAFVTNDTAIYTIQPVTPFTFNFNLALTAPFGGFVELYLDGVLTDSWTVFSPVEEEESMPAHVATETLVTAANGGVATRADPTPVSNRYRVRIINTSAADRVWVARSQAGAETVTAEVIEADFGIWEDFVDDNVQIWVRAAGTVDIPVRVIQYATA